MSNTKMLIDATHPEETRVVVQRNGRVEEFDFESAARKLLRGNIYLAKVTRVEPSLQAAFVDYGGNRHGFLAFNEIHPDYYQIPVADRQALIDEEAAAEAELEAAADRRAEALARRSSGRRPEHQSAAPSMIDSEPHDDDHAMELPDAEAGGEASHIIDVEEDEHIEEVGGDSAIDDVPQTLAASIGRDLDIVSEAHAGDSDGDDSADDEPAFDDNAAAALPHHHEAEDEEGDGNDIDAEDSDDETPDEGALAADAGHLDPSPEAHEPGGLRGLDVHDEGQARQRRRPRSYKIQEVIKRRQVILVQIVKEERGNKGAALTTYLSLAGRYTVLMPNTARGGGISRKITNPQDRKRLKAIAQELEVPEGMGLIIRTAGAARTKQEIKRDFEYLLRLWESVRDLTLQSTAPALVYEEGDLIKRSIRDLYNKDVEEVVVAGEAGHQEAADFMRMLMPSHSKNVVGYKDPTPLFTKYGVERQLNAMFLPQVTLRSGGYIVINQTEALVAIDVNSGKSTREFSIEETALATNLEASDEIARQLKLRDLAGLIVIDFIDMEEKRNNRSVERRLKDALRFDRARIQLGRISHFGLMEMSRQRLRTGVLEGSTTQCPHCQGTGIIRSTESVALAVLRGLEDTITAGATGALVATTTPAVALYILNSKRAYVTDMEVRHGYSVTIVGSDRVQGANFTVERGASTAVPLRRPERAAVNMDWGFEGEDEAPSFEGGAIETVSDGDEEVERAPRARQGREGGREGGRDQGRDASRDAGRDASRDQVREPGRDDGRDSGDGEDDSNRPGRRRRRGRGRGGRDGRGEDVRPGAARVARGPEQAGQEHGDSRAGGGVAEPSFAEEAANDRDETTGNEAGQIEGRGERSEDSRGDQAGRRRRRGRRGGRRGRGDRDETTTAQDGAPRNGARQANSDTLSDGTEAVGFGPQPEVDAAAFGRNGGNNAASTGRVSVAPAPAERARPERIWDVPSSTPAPQPVAKPIAEQQASRSAPPVDVPLPDNAAQDSAASRRRHETGSSEPRIERVVVSPDLAADGSGDGTAAPQRKGWWQRRFGSE